MRYRKQLRQASFDQSTRILAALPPFDHEAFQLFLEDSERTRYHEAGHAVAFYLCRLQPKRIRGAMAHHDRRTTPCLHSSNVLLRSAVAKEKAHDYAICTVAGIVAESRVCGIPVSGLRDDSGRFDYEAARKISDLLMLSKGIIGSDGTFAAHLHLWETTAACLLDHRLNWSAVEEVASELMEDGTLERRDLTAAIRRGLSQAVPRSGACLRSFTLDLHFLLDE